MSAVREAEIVPIGIFHLWQSGALVWRVAGPADCCGGLFASPEAAARFVRSEAVIRGWAPRILHRPPFAGRAGKAQLTLAAGGDAPNAGAGA